MRKVLLLLLMFFILPSLTFSQSAANYTLATFTNGSLSSDMNSNTIDMSTGTTILLPGGSDNTRSSLYDIGFIFYMLYDVNGQEKRYSEFSVSSNGRLRLGYFESSNRYVVGRDGEYGIVAPMTRNLAIHSTGKVHYKLVGTAPNRCLVVEWKNMEMDKNSSTADATFQARLYETTGVVEFVYGSMAVGTGGGTNDYQVGISNDDASDRYFTIQTSNHSFSTTTKLNNTYTEGATIPELHSTTDGSRRIYRLSPNTPTAPTAQAYSNIQCASARLNWTDNATTEIAYEIFQSQNPGGPFEYIGKANIDATNYTVQGLQENTTYYFQIHALSEGRASTTVDLGSVTTTASCNTCTTIANGNWSDAATWSCGRAPYSYEHAIVNHTVTVTNSPTARSLTVNSGGQVAFADQNNRNMRIYGDVTINTGGSIISAPNNPSQLNIYGNMVVDGEYDGYRGTSGTTVTFLGSEDNTLSGTGAICDFYNLQISKGQSTAPILDIQREITIREPSGNNQSLTIMQGTLKISSASVLTTHSGNRGSVSSQTGKLWLNHADAEIKHATETNAFTFWDLLIDNGKITNAGGINFNSSTQFENGTIDTGTGNISIRGNFVMNNGSISCANFYEYKQMTINGGTLTTTATFLIDGTSKGNSTITGGTLNIGSNADIENKLTITGGNINITNQLIVDADGSDEYGELTFDNATLVAGTNVYLSDNANLQLNSGTITTGDGDDYCRVRDNSELNIAGGTFTIYGRMYFDNEASAPAKFTMTNGNLFIDPQHTTYVANEDALDITNNTIVNFTGGILTFVDPIYTKTNGNRVDLEVDGTAGAKNFSGSTIRFGDGTSTSAQGSISGDRGFKMSAPANVTFDNIEVNNPISGGPFPDRVLVLHSNVSSTTNITNLTLTNVNTEVKISGNELNISGNLINNNIIDGSANNSHLQFVGNVAQSYSGTGSLTDYLKELTFNNTSPTGVTLSAPLGAELVHLTDGHVYTSTGNELTVFGTTPTSIDGYSSSNYVQGPMKRALPNNASNQTYEFPIGKTDYRLFELVEVNSSGSGIGFVTLEVFEPVNMNGKTGGAGLFDPTSAETIYWKLDTDLSSVVLDNATAIRVTYNDPGAVPPRVLAQSNTGIDGPYIGIEKTVVGGKLESTGFDFTGLNSTGSSHIIISEVEPLEGTYTVGEDVSADFRNLTEVAAELRIKYVNDNVKFELLDDYDPATETLPIVFDKLMVTQANFDVTIYPQTSAKTISLAGATDNEALIIFDNISNLKFDGRIAATGTARSWTIQNTRGTNPGPVFEFRDDASDNELNYLTAQSNNTAATSGVILFGTTDQTNGNDDNIIQNCQIKGYSSTPTNGIYSSGTTGASNSGNQILNCEIANCFNTTADSHAILLSDENTSWTLQSNKIYQEAARVYTSAATYFGIRITDGNNHTVDNNFIGAAAADATGFTDISGSSSTFRGIRIDADNGTNTTVRNNTISQIKFSTASNANDPGFFSGIQVTSGDVIVGGSGNGNTIGSTGNFADYPIQITFTVNGGRVNGICTSANRPTVIRNNGIGGIKITGDFNINFTGIFTNRNDGNSDFVIDKNTIGSTTQANSIQLGETNYVNRCEAIGIYNYRSSSITISNNTIQNIISHTTNNNWRTSLRGIFCIEDQQIITGNTIANLASFSRTTDSSVNACVLGIARSNTTADQQISDNTIHSLQSLDATSSCYVIGIILRANGSSADSLNRNKIHNLSVASDNGHIVGLDIEQGRCNAINNMIGLGYDKDGNSITQSAIIYGIRYDSSDDCNFLYNSVYLGGTGVTSTTGKNSYAMYKKETALSTIQNNIWINERSNASGTDSKHYAYFLSYEDVVRSDYNIFYAPNAGGILANYDGNDQATLRAMQSYSSREDLHSGVGNPNFLAPTGDASTFSLFLDATTPAYNSGIVVSGIKNDVTGNSNARSGSDGEQTNIGADATIRTADATVDIFSPNFDFLAIEPQNCGVTSLDLDVQITDQISGVPTSGADRPTLWIRDNTLDWTSASSFQGTLQSGDGNDAVWRFSITGLSDGILYEYYITAQDQATTTNIGFSRFDDNSPVHTNVLTATTAPDTDVDIDAFSVCVYPKATYFVGNKTDCPTCEFENLTGVDNFFYNMNAMLIDKDVVCYISADTEEPGTYPLRDVKDSPAGSNFVIQIAPDPALASSAQVHGAATLNKKLIRLEGAKNTLINGQKSGDKNRWLDFVHDKNDQTVLYFVEDAQDNTIQYVSLKAAAELTPRGVIFFDTTSVATPSGNTGNVIQYCEITSNTLQPQNLIYSQGNVSAPNANNTIRANKMSDFGYNGIWITDTGNGNGWTIVENSLFNPTIGTDDQNGLLIESGEGHHIVDNQIGGTQLDGSGTWENTDRWANFHGMYLNLSNGTKTEISNNTISNVSTSYSGQSGGITRGIYLEAGYADIENNTIKNLQNDRNSLMTGIRYDGASDVSISENIIENFTYNGTSDFYGIRLTMDNNTNQNQIYNNTVRSITTTNNNTGADFYGIYSSNGAQDVVGNTIGSTNASEKISFAGRGDFRAIDMYSGQAFRINNNSFINIETTGADDLNLIRLRNILNNTDIPFENNFADELTLFADNTLRLFQLDDGRIITKNNTMGTASGGIHSTATVDLEVFRISPPDNNFQIDKNTFTNITSENNDITCIILPDENRPFTVNNNTISGFNITHNINFTGIKINRGNNFVADGNTIKDISLPNATNDKTISGIWVSRGTGTVGASSSNNIGSVAEPISSANGRVFGVRVTNTSGTLTVQKTNVEGLSSDQLTAGLAIDGGGYASLVNNTVSQLSGTTEIAGIWINGSTGNTISVQSNKIENFTISGTTSFSGIKVTEGLVNIGNTNANIIGHQSTANSITNSGTGAFYGINVISSANNNNISNNLIANITQNGVSDFSTMDLSVGGGTASAVDNNTVRDISGNATGTYDLSCIKLSGGNFTLGNTTGNTLGENVSYSGAGKLTGVYSLSSNNLTISNTTINGLRATSTDANVSLTGIWHDGTGSATISANTVSNIQSVSTNASVAGKNLAVQGIAFTGNASGGTVVNNTITDIQSTVATAIATQTVGINTSGADGLLVNRNLIYGLINASTSATAQKTGIKLGSTTGTITTANNMITMGNVTNQLVRGIWVNEVGTGTHQVYYNSVYLTGISGAPSYAFLSDGVDTNVELKNNIFYNVSGASQYAIGSLSNTKLVSDYNNLFAADANYTGNWNGGPGDLGTWQAASSQDINSFDVSVSFIDAANADLHIDPSNNCDINGRATPVSVTTDYDAATRRATRPDLGADEFQPTGGNELADFWTGAESTAWEDPLNWGCDLIPVATTAITINNETNDPIVNGPATAIGASIDQKTGANLSILDNQNLDITGNGTFNGEITTGLQTSFKIGGNATFANSVAIGNSSDFDITGNAVFDSNVTAGEVSQVLTGGDLTFNGNVTLEPQATILETGSLLGNAPVEMQLRLGGYKTSLFTSPLPNQSTDVITKLGGQPNYWNDRLYFFDEVNSVASNISENDDDWYHPFTDESTPGTFEVTRGYSMFYNDWHVIRFSGTTDQLKVNDFTYQITNQATGIYKGYNLVGNPYPSAIDADEFLQQNAVDVPVIDGTLYFWDDDGSAGSNYEASDYATWNGAGSLGGGNHIPNGKISSMQGFFVKISTANSQEDLVFKKSMREANTSQFFKKSQQMVQRFKFSVSNRDHYNEALIAFLDGATDGFDRLYDGKKLKGNSNIALYSFLSGQPYAIQSFEPISYSETEERVVPVGLDIHHDGFYSFSAESYENLHGINVYLVDKKLRDIHPMNMGDYHFEAKKGKEISRFELIFTDKILSREDLRSREPSKPKIFTTRNVLKIDFNRHDETSGKVQIFNQQGSIINEFSYKNEYQIRKPLHIQSGLYIVRLFINEESYSERVMFFD